MAGFETWSAMPVWKGDMAKKLKWQSAAATTSRASVLNGKHPIPSNILSKRCDNTSGNIFLRINIHLPIKITEECLTLISGTTFYCDEKV